MMFRALFLFAGRSTSKIASQSFLRTGYPKHSTVARLQTDEKPSMYGQPLYQSHPHLLKPDELTPGIPSEEYEWRRRKLLEALPDDSMVVSMAAPVKYMSGNIFYKYRQASDFWYLTGFNEPDSAVILEKTSTSRGYKMTLFCSGKDSRKEKWDGARTSVDEAANIFNADDAFTIEHFPSHLRVTLSRYSHVFVDVPPTFIRKGTRSTTKSILKYFSPPLSARSDSDSILESLSNSRRKPLAPEVSRLRSIKSQCEQQIMRAAADIGGRSHAKTMRFARPGLSEGALAAHFEYLCILSGAQRLAYVPVVASGPNALVIHYTSNNHLIRDGEMLLVDAGCEYNGYASDITRSYPVSGSFTPAQKALYSAVLSTQKALVGLCTESAQLSLHDLHHKSCELLKQELNQIGFGLQHGDLERILYPHFLSHPIGIDLHESSNFDRSGPLIEGMVITIEPGIYVPPVPSLPIHYHNMGIRIEDMVLVGKNLPTVLSVTAPKEIVDIEGACQGILGLEAF